MKKPTLGWQSWSPPYPKWHGLPRWDYSSSYDESIVRSTISSRPLRSPLSYWCTWYAYDTKINDELLNRNLDHITHNRLGFTHILLDDGWCAWGDWLYPDQKKFASLDQTLTNIKTHGFKVGLWFAPFLADKSSQLYQQHPDWFVTYHERPIQGLNIMPIWNRVIPQRYLLDFSNIAVQEYTKRWLHQSIQRWGVDLLKLDFLYAPYTNPNPQNHQIASRQIKWLLSYIKRTYPRVQTIACGAPFADCNGLVDAIRVSKDTALPPTVPHWFNKIIYANRVKMLTTTLQSDVNPKLNLDSDVRMFSLDTPQTSRIWDKIQTPIIGVGDRLLNLTKKHLLETQTWLNNHSSLS